MTAPRPVIVTTDKQATGLRAGGLTAKERGAYRDHLAAKPVLTLTEWARLCLLRCEA